MTVGRGGRLILMFGAVLAFPVFARGLPPLRPSVLKRVRASQATRVRQAASHLRAIRGRLGVGADTDVVLRRAHTDRFGETHVRFQQTYRGVPVWGGAIISHQAVDGTELPPTSALVRGLKLEVEPALTVDEAIAHAGRALAVRGRPLRPSRAALVVYPEFTTILPPGPVAKINAIQVKHILKTAVLVYHVEIAESVAGAPVVTELMVDARTGRVLKRWNGLETAASVGTGNSQYSGTVSLDTDTLGGGSFELLDSTRGTGAPQPYTGDVGNAVRDMANGITGYGTLYSDTDDTWGDGTQYNGGSTTSANGQTAAVDAAYGLQETWDYYVNVHGRNGIDGKGTAALARVHFSTAYDNAFWDNGCFCMTYGDGSGPPSGFSTVTELDVTGHELTHGVTANTAGLIYSGESGGLDESSSDINGTMVEFYARGGSGSTIGNTGGNWTIGEQLSSPPLRYMYKPSLDGSSLDAWSTTLSGLDPHYSSGPMNRCFYFLSQGASSNSGSNDYSSFLPGGMTGIGNDEAARIWYRALTTYLYPSADYAAARNAGLMAARDLYGQNSTEYRAVQDAFAAINVGRTAGAYDDVTPPTVNLTATSTGETLHIVATASDDIALNGIELRIDRGGMGTPLPIAVFESTSASFDYDVGDLAPGTHAVQALAYDLAGNTAKATVQFTVNWPWAQLLADPGFEANSGDWTTTADVINSPADDGATGHGFAWLDGYGARHTDDIAETVTLPSSATAASLNFWLLIATNETTTNRANDTLQVRIENGGGTVLATLATYSNLDATNGYVRRSFDLSAYLGQTITVHLLGQEDRSNATSFLVDDFSLRVLTSADVTPPTVVAHESGMSGTLNLSAEASDDIAVTRVEFYLDGSATPAAIDTTAPYSAGVLASTLTYGPHQLIAKAFDAAGNVGTSAQVTFEVDDGSGAPDSLSPTVTASEAGAAATITYSATAEDNVGVTRVEFHLDGSATAAATVTAAPYSATVDSTTLANGSHRLEAWAYDAAGNIGKSSAVSFGIYNAPTDTTPPSVTAAESGTGGTLSLSATATDDVRVSSVEFFIDGSYVGYDLTSPFGIGYDATALASGTHGLVAKAYDERGNVGTSAPVAFNLPSAGAVSVSISPASAAVSAAGGTRQFSATVTNASNPSVTWSVQEAGGGTVDGTGRYTAPTTPGVFHVVATSVEDSTQSATAAVVVYTGDLDGDGKVDEVDMGLLGDAYGSTPSDPAWNPNADLDQNGVVDDQDITLFRPWFGR